MNKDFQKNHSSKDLASARAFLKMTEESLFWYSRLNFHINHRRIKYNICYFFRVCGLSRFVHEPDPKFAGVHPAIMWYLARTYRKRGNIQGYARHSKEECKYSRLLIN